MKGCQTTSIHKMCIANSKIDRFLTVYPKLTWTDNILFARVFDSDLEVIEFQNIQVVKEFLKSELNMIIWTDTKKSICDK